MKKKRKDSTTEERMKTVEVARYVGISYQTAYNRVLSGVYGPSEYDAKTRTMTVSASVVRKAKLAQESDRKHART